jgi:hypothetical protein
MALPDMILAVGDTTPPLVQTWTDENGNPLDLTGWAIVWSMQDQARVNAPLVGGTVTVTNTPSGTPAVMSMAWAAGNTAIAAFYDGEFTATKAGASMTWPRERTLTIEVRPHV